MQETIAVIGANYGDEGKGRLTNFLADDESCVVRYSGSAQAGHTVVEEGRRHVFKHFGSGSLRGIQSYLTSDFLLHPIMFEMESHQLNDIIPVVTVDPRSLVVLPTDMIINQAVEKMRGESRHGSCGMGVRQAQERSTSSVLRVTFGDLEDCMDLSWLTSLCNRHLEVWCGMNGHDSATILELAGVNDLDSVMRRFMDSVRFMDDRVEIGDRDGAYHHLVHVRRLVFEGSQGLALDPGVGCLPHLTPSHVGLGGLASFIRENSYEPELLELVYATRPYLTRHGAGPLSHEGEWWIPVRDDTNQRNDWQGSLRFAPLHMGDMMERITRDLRWGSLIPENVNFRISLGVTCLDHVENSDFPFYDLDGGSQHGLSAFLNECGRMMSALAEPYSEGRLITCYGENRDDTHDSGVSDGISAAA